MKQLGVIMFGSVRFLSKTNNQTKFFKKNKPKPVQSDRFQFGSVWFFGQKPVFSGLSQFFFGFFPVWILFGFFSFRFIKLKPNQPVFSKF
jgi:hypothetical protein